MHVLLRVFALFVIRLFYRQIAVGGAQRIPAGGPVVVVANHPNGLLDPLVLRVALGRPVAFLAKSTLFGNPLGRVAMRAFDAIPVFRAKDGGDTSRNEETFRRARQLLARNGWLALFPEGVSHADPELKPLKTGAARIAISAAKEQGGAAGLRIVPIGLLYEDRALFRTRVAVQVGEAIGLDEVLAHEDERAAVELLTRRIDDALSDVVLEADSREVWNGLVAVASWTAPDGGRDLAAVEERARGMARALRRVREEEPERAERVVAETAHYARMLRFLGVNDPFSLEPPAPLGLRAIVALAWPLVALAPIALPGIVLGWLPYRAVGIVTARVTQEEDVVSTVKAVAGMLFFTVWYVGLALAASFVWSPLAGLEALLFGPLSAFVALGWVERLALRRSLLRGHFLRATESRLVEAVRQRRLELCALVERELARAG